MRRKLILVVRGTPFSIIHVENMTRLASARALMMPANPGFYNHPQTVDDLVDFMIAPMPDQLKIPHTLVRRLGSG